MPSDGTVPVSVVVLTFNEELNLPACLDSVTGWAAKVFVLDSGSTDQTVAIARARGAVITTHAFDTHARQWQWALDNLPIETEWVLGLDADQHVSTALSVEIAALVSSNTPADGAFVRRRQIFRGKWIRYGGYYPKHLLKLFKRRQVQIDASDLVDHHFSLAGPTVVLSGDLIEDNRNEAQIAVWTAKHNRYAVLQARQESSATAGSLSLLALFGNSDDRVRLLKKIWAGLPLFVRPCLYVFYRYVIRLGFLDGKQGFIFHVLQAFWYRLLVDINIDELRTAALDSSRSDAVAVSRSRPAVESTVTTKHGP